MLLITRAFKKSIDGAGAIIQKDWDSIPGILSLPQIISEWRAMSNLSANSPGAAPKQKQQKHKNNKAIRSGLIIMK